MKKNIAEEIPLRDVIWSCKGNLTMKCTARLLGVSIAYASMIWSGKR